MNTSHVASNSLAENPAAGRKRNVRGLAVALIIGAFCFGIGGCVGDGFVGVSTYPSYAPYYGYYGYSGIPYYGYGGIYRRSIIVRGRRHFGGYGRHHFSRYHRGHRQRSHGSRSAGRGREYHRSGRDGRRR